MSKVKRRRRRSRRSRRRSRSGVLFKCSWKTS